MSASQRDPAQERAALAATYACIAQAGAAGQDHVPDADLQGLLRGWGLVTDAPADGANAWRPHLRLRLEATREFGFVLSARPGGALGNLQPTGESETIAVAAPLTYPHNFLQQLQPTRAYAAMATDAQQQQLLRLDDHLLACLQIVLQLAYEQDRTNAAGALGILCLEVDLFACADGLAVSHAQCRLAAPIARRLPRPLHKIEHLLHPKSIGVIGVSSTSMNFGRIILKNLIGSGYPKEQLCVIREGEAEIDGVRCMASLQAIPQKLDLLIVAVAAQAVYPLVDEIVANNQVHAVMLIPGGLGETRASKEPAAELAAKIQAAHARPDGGPIFLGANCLGVVSHAGGYDSWFIPLERLPKPAKKPVRRAAMVSQSGAFMITRLSQNPWLDPRYMLALGNQTDLTHGDLMQYFAQHTDIQTIGVYIEGFKDLDGLDFACAVRKATLAGKQVVVYKAGRTESGALTAQGHTASFAGDPSLFDAVVTHAGALVAHDFSSFDDLFYIAGELHDKHIEGFQLGGISGAGFEAVGIADSIAASHAHLQMGALQESTLSRVQEVLREKKLDALVEVRNPIDINPGADDEAHLQVVQAFLDDPGIDAVVVGLDPTAPMVRALPSSQLRPGYDLQDPKSTAQLMPILVQSNHKPVVGIVDGGPLYDAMASRLMDQGVCVFRNCARGTRALARYITARLRAKDLQKEQAQTQTKAG